MARSGHTDVEFNDSSFDGLLRQPKVEALVDNVAEVAMSNMKASAPVDSGDYRDAFHIEHHESRYRRTARVVNDDEKVLVIESKQGVMARGLKAAKR